MNIYNLSYLSQLFPHRMLESCETFDTLCTYHFWRLEGSRWQASGRDRRLRNRFDSFPAWANDFDSTEAFTENGWSRLKYCMRLCQIPFHPRSQKVMGIISKSSSMKSWMAFSCHDCNSEPGPSHLEQVEVYRHDLMTSRYPRPQLPCLRTLAHSGAIKKCQMVVAVSVASIHFKVSLSQKTLFRPLRVAPRSSSSSKMRLTWHSSWFRGMHRRPRPNKYNKSQGVVQQILGSHINE